MITFLTRVVHFSSAHRYHRPEWSEEENRGTFGACANPHGHGHNYALEVMVAGAPHGETGFCADLGRLDRVLHEKVLVPLDHQHINHAIPDFRPGGKIPTTENIIIWIWEQIAAEITDARLVRLRLREEATLFVDYFGPEEVRQRPDGRGAVEV